MIKVFFASLLLFATLVISSHLILGTYFVYDYKCTKGLVKEVSIGFMFSVMGNQINPMIAYAFQQEALKVHYGRKVACEMKSKIGQIIPQPVIDFLENE